MVDVVCAELPSRDERVHADVSVRAGGSAVNAALAAAAAGAAATVVGRVGADAAGDLVAAELAERGIEARLARDPELTTGAAVALGSSVVAHRGANARLSVDDIPEPLEADALLVSGFALFQHGSAAAARAALARFSGHWAAVDLASPTLAAAADLNELAGAASVVLATDDEARAATGAEPEEAARLLASRFALACVKLGVEGVIAARGDRIERARAGRVAAYSTFGSGDAFAGVLLVSLARDDSLARALGLACEAGARSVAEPRG
jgi:sugar/nucleoside kinase (ribokinase family)